MASGGPKKIGVLPTWRVCSSRVSAGAIQVGSPRSRWSPSASSGRRGSGSAGPPAAPPGGGAPKALRGWSISVGDRVRLLEARILHAARQLRRRFGLQRDVAAVARAVLHVVRVVAFGAGEPAL